MSRWKPNASGRLQQAALELYSECGFESTTVAEIARRAGLTERTFFRHFADKREVLFAGVDVLRELLVGKVCAAPVSLAPMGAVATALDELATEVFEEGREHARKRQAVIAANPELQERELIKLATLASALAEALRGRGVEDPAAALAAEAGMAVFRVAFDRWVNDPEGRPLAQFVRESMDELRLVTGGGEPAPGGGR